MMLERPRVLKLFLKSGALTSIKCKQNANQSVQLRTNRACHESRYLRRYLQVHPWENPCKQITRIRVTWRLQNPRVQVSVLDHTQPVRVTRTTRVYFSKHSRTTTTTRRMGSFKNEVG